MRKIFISGLIFMVFLLFPVRVSESTFTVLRPAASNTCYSPAVLASVDETQGIVPELTLEEYSTVTPIFEECVTEELISEEVYEEYTYTEEVYEEPIYEASSSDEGWQYYGTCFITHYCNCELCCGKWAGGNTASGTYPTAGRTVAMMSMPFGTQVLIDGFVYTVEDRGYWDEMWVDIYVDSHEEAYACGAYYTEVYIR